MTLKTNNSCILLADDDRGIREPLTVLLQYKGFTVVQASSEPEMRRCAQDCDVWIIDVRLPSKDYEGILAVFTLANSGVRCKHSIIFISVDSKEMAAKHLQGLSDLGIQFEWIEKPFEFEYVLKTVNRILRNI